MPRPRTEKDTITLASVCHCEHPKGAWQSDTQCRCEAKPRQSPRFLAPLGMTFQVRLLRFTRKDDSYLCSKDGGQKEKVETTIRGSGMGWQAKLWSGGPSSLRGQV